MAGEPLRPRDLDPLDVGALRGYADELDAGCERERALIGRLAEEHARLDLRRSVRRRRAYAIGIGVGVTLGLVVTCAVGVAKLFI